ncbi:MAG TPA: hypothetical protein PLQ00_13890 [Thermoguttaceae bacterium]|nr:hypothetical protein [Thermoguttaceae bacterium]
MHPAKGRSARASLSCRLPKGFYLPDRRPLGHSLPPTERTGRRLRRLQFLQDLFGSEWTGRLPARLRQIPVAASR